MVFSETAKHARHSKLHSLTPVITDIPTRQEKRTHSEQGRDYVLKMLLTCLHARSEDADNGGMGKCVRSCRVICTGE